MFVCLTITLKTFKFLTLLVARAATTGGKGAAPPKPKFCPPNPKVTKVENSGMHCKRPL